MTGVAGLRALSAADSLERARAGLTAVQDEAATEQSTTAALRQARRDLAEARSSLASWPVDVVAAVPVLGRSWDAERAVARTSRAVVDGGIVLAERLPDMRAGAGGVDLNQLAQVRSALVAPAADSRTALDELRRMPLGLTPAQVGQGVRQADDALAPAVRTLEQADTGLGLLQSLLGGEGPRSLMVMLQNNAELRGAGGYAASFAVGSVADGRLELGTLQDVASVADPIERARRVPAPAEYVHDYGPMSGDTTLWRSWNMSPHVPDSALVGARVAGEVLGTAPDVMVLLDVPALGALASLGGGRVQLPDGRSVSPQELTDALLVDAYAEAGSDGAVQRKRRADLQRAATAAVQRLLAGGVSAAETARTMARLAEGRHFSVWSDREQEQQALEALGLSGSVQTAAGGDLSLVSVNNIGANKLDIYVDRDLAVDVVVGPHTASVTQRVRFTNKARSGLVPYVAGYEHPGVVLSRVELSLPPDATGVAATVDGGTWTGTLTPGEHRMRLATRVDLPIGGSTLLEVRYTVPVTDGTYRLRLLPQPLVHDADLRLSVRPADGGRFGGVSGAALDKDGVVAESSPLASRRDVVVRPYVEPETRWERLQRWWREPVRLD